MIFNSHRYFHWAYFELRKRHLYNVGTAVFIWLFLLLTRPFGLYTTGVIHFFQLAFLLVPVSFCFLLATYTVDLLVNLSKPQKNVRADFLHWVLKWILFVHFVYILRLSRCEWVCFDWVDYGEQWFANMVMIAFTYTPFILYGKYHFINENGTDKKLRLIAEGKNDVLIDPSKLVYIKADDNYVDIFQVGHNDEVYVQTLRSTLASVQKQLEKFPRFRRVHRSYIINNQFVIGERSKMVKVQHGSWIKDLPVSAKYKDT